MVISMTNVEEILVEEVENRQGCKATELAYALAERLPNCQDISSLISACVLKGLVDELEYVLPNMTYRIKSWILPAGTIVNFATYTKSRTR